METSQEVVIIPNDIEEAKPDAEQIKSAEQAPTTETVEEAAKPAEENKADKTFTQAELDDIVQKRIAKVERKAERQRIEAETRQRVEQEYAQKTATLPDEPNVEDFSDYGDYLKAAAKWEVKQELAAEREANRMRETQQKNQSEADRLNERRQDLIQAGEKKYDDFEEVMTSSNVRISEPARMAMLESDISHEIAYYLAKNPAEAERVGKLTDYAQAKEIGKLEDKLSAKQPLKISAAPEPIKPIGSGQTLNKTVDEMSVEEYKAYRLTQKPRWA